MQFVDVAMFSNGKFKNIVASSVVSSFIEAHSRQEVTVALTPQRGVINNWIALEESYSEGRTGEKTKPIGILKRKPQSVPSSENYEKDDSKLDLNPEEKTRELCNVASNSNRQESNDHAYESRSSERVAETDMSLRQNSHLNDESGVDAQAATVMNSSENLSADKKLQDLNPPENFENPSRTNEFLNKTSKNNTNSRNKSNPPTTTKSTDTGQTKTRRSLGEINTKAGSSRGDDDKERKTSAPADNRIKNDESKSSGGRRRPGILSSTVVRGPEEDYNVFAIYVSYYVKVSNFNLIECCAY